MLMSPHVSIIIPMKNEELRIGRCLDSIAEGSYPMADCEVLIVDGGSTDRSCSIAESKLIQFPFARLIHNPKKTLPAGLNMAVRLARGSYIIRMDAHCEYQGFGSAWETSLSTRFPSVPLDERCSTLSVYTGRTFHETRITNWTRESERLDTKSISHQNCKLSTTIQKIWRGSLRKQRQTGKGWPGAGVWIQVVSAAGMLFPCYLL